MIPVSRTSLPSWWAIASLLGLSACVSAPPRSVSHVASVAPSPAEPWTPPPGAGAPLKPNEAKPAVRPDPTDPVRKIERLFLADVVELALESSPLTKASWAQARAAAATVGSARGRYLPTLSVDATGGPSQVISANPARLPPDRSVLNTSASLQWLLFDFGARGGAMTAAREGMFAADLSHNAMVQNVVLEAESAYFTYQAYRGLLQASQATVQTAQTNLAAAQRRHDVGLATIADVLQAQTALAQAQLTEQTAEGNVQAARASLALAIGVTPNAAFEAGDEPESTQTYTITESVDSLIARAERSRPDVAAARALARQSEAQVRVARSLTLPTMIFGATTGRSFANIPALEGRTYGLSVGFSFPIFNGLTRQYDVVAAQENAAAAVARADLARLQAAAQVFSSYYALRTAAQRISTATDLLASATRSEEVARGRYAEGVGSVLDLLTAQSALADARAQSVQARWTWYATFAQLARDAGVLDTRGGMRLTSTAGPAVRSNP